MMHEVSKLSSGKGLKSKIDTGIKNETTVGFKNRSEIN